MPRGPLTVDVDVKANKLPGCRRCGEDKKTYDLAELPLCKTCIYWVLTFIEKHESELESLVFAAPEVAP